MPGMKNITAIDGSIQFWIGQRWQENDPRSPRKVEVVAIDAEGKRVQIMGAVKRWAKASRFNGRRTGYSQVTE